MGEGRSLWRLHINALFYAPNRRSIFSSLIVEFVTSLELCGALISLLDWDLHEGRTQVLPTFDFASQLKGWGPCLVDDVQ